MHNDSVVNKCGINGYAQGYGKKKQRQKVA